MGLQLPGRARALWPWVGFCLAIGVTLVGWRVVKNSEQARIRNAFEAEVHSRVNLISQRLAAEEQILRGAAEYASQKGTVTRSDWRDYVQALELSKRYPGIQGLGFATWTPRAELERHEGRQRAEGFPDYKLRPLGDLPPDSGGFAPVVFLEPLDERNVRIIGRDVWSEPERRKALIRARDLGVVAATARVRLVQDDDRDPQSGIILYAPVYRRGARLDSVAERRRALVGWTNLPLRMDDHVQGILGQLPEGLLVQVFEGVGSDADPLFPSGTERRQVLSKGWRGARLVQAQTIEVAGRAWLIQAQADGRFTALRGEGSHWIFLAGGALGSVLMFLVLWSMARSEVRAERLAVDRLDELVSQQAAYAAVIASLSEGLILYSEEGAVKACNPAAMEILGLSERQLVAQGLVGAGWSVVDESGAPLPPDLHPVARAIRTGKPQEAVLGLTSPQGRFWWLQSKVSPVRRTGNEKAGSVVATILDVTEQRRAELALRDAEQTFRNLFERSPNAVSITRMSDALILDVNEAWSRLFGWSKAEALGRTLYDLGVYAGPEDRRALLEVLQQDRIVDAWAFTTSRKDGTRIHTSLGVASVIQEGQECALTVLQDHTQSREAERALRESEARWKFAIEGAGDGLWDWDALTDQVYYSTSWKAMLGYGEEEIKDTLQEWDSRIHPEDRAGVMQTLRRHLEGGTAMYQSEHRLRCKGGDYRWVLDRGMVVRRTDEGGPARFIGIHTDLTERRNAEASQREAHKAEGLGLMAAGIAHDFNNLFQALLGHLELAQPRSDPSGRQHLDRAMHSLDRASDLSKRLLEFSGGSYTQLEPLAINPLVREVTEFRLRGDRLGLQLALAANLPEVVGDPLQLRQVLGILVDNAVEAIGPGGGTVTVTSEHLRALPPGERSIGLWAGEVPAGPLVRLSVSDSGGGAGPGVMNRLFDPFFSTKAMGRGLGLASALGLVRGNLGGLQVLDRPGEGMTFRIYLSTDRRAVKRGPIPAPAIAREGRAVLVADDEADLRQVIAEALRECHGCQVFEAADGVEAIEILQAHRDEIGLVLIDCVMPRMKGPDAFDEIRRIRPGTQGILMSGFSEETGQNLAARHGFAAFLKKPFPLKDLSDLMAELQGQTGDTEGEVGSYS